jgi:hypothetical protein
MVRTRCKPWVYLEPSKGLQERTKTTQKPLGFIGNHKKDPGRQVLRLQLGFSGVLWAVWVGASWDGSPVFDD